MLYHFETFLAILCERTKSFHSINWIWRKRPGSCKLFTFWLQTWWRIHIVVLKGKVPVKLALLEKWKLITFNSPSYGDTPKCRAYERIILSKWVLNLIYSGSLWSLLCRNYFEFYDAISVLSETMYDGWLCNRKFRAKVTANIKTLILI